MTALNRAVASARVGTEVIRVRGLTFRYPKAAEPAVRGMEFTVGRGEIFGLLGPSGAGKSTTQKLLIGLLRDHGGQATVWDKEPAEWGPDYYERIGVSFELPNHYQKLTGYENLRFFASLYAGATADPMQLLAAVGLADDAHTLVGKYSKGMQMRLTFARSLINDPELLFLDEPTSGLDPVNARKIKDIIVDLKARGRTIFLTTHDMATADELCDRVAFFFVGGTVFFEKQERTIGAIVSTPLRFWEYLAAKLTVLLAISLFVAVVVATIVHGLGYHLLPLVAGIVLGTLLMLLVGFSSSLPFASVTDWFLAAVIPLAIMLAPPVVHYSGLWPNPVLYLIPTQGPLLLLGAAFDQVSLAPWQVGYAVVYPIVCAAGLCRAAKALFGRYVVQRSGVL